MSTKQISRRQSIEMRARLDRLRIKDETFLTQLSMSRARRARAQARARKQAEIDE